MTTWDERSLGLNGALDHKFTSTAGTSMGAPCITWQLARMHHGNKAGIVLIWADVVAKQCNGVGVWFYGEGWGWLQTSVR